MAATFTNTAHYIGAGTAAIPATGTFAAWVYPTWAQGDNTTHVLFDVRSGTSYFHLLKHSDNGFRAGWTVSGTDYRIVAAAGTYTLNQNAWNSIIYTWDDTANEDYLYINGVEEASSLVSLVTWNTNGQTKCIGNYDGATLDWRGRIAELAIWPRVLTTAERAIYDAGFCPLLVPGGNGTFYWPLIRGLGDRWGGNTGTASGATVADHAPIIYPKRKQLGHTLPFTVNATTGEITIAENTGLAADQVWTVTVRVTDAVAATDDGAVTITLTAGGTTILPNPVTVSWSIVSPGLIKIISLPALSTIWSVVAPGLGKITKPDAISATWSVITPTLVEIIKPSVIAATWSVVIPTTYVTTTPAAVSVSWLIGVVNLVQVTKPNIVTASWSVITPSLLETIKPSPTGATWSVITPEVTMPSRLPVGLLTSGHYGIGA